MRFDTVADHDAGVTFCGNTGNSVHSSLNALARSWEGEPPGEPRAHLGSDRASPSRNHARSFSVTTVVSVANDAGCRLLATRSFRTICTAPPANGPRAGLKPPSVCHVRHEQNRRVVSSTPLVLCANRPSRHLFFAYVTVCHGMSPSVTDRLRSYSRVMNGLPTEYVIRQTERRSHAQPQRRSL